MITDKFQNEYSKGFTTDGEGNFQIAVTDLPDGLLNNYGGIFSLEVLANYSNANVPMNLTASYEKAFIKVLGGTFVQANIGNP